MSTFTAATTHVAAPAPAHTSATSQARGRGRPAWVAVAAAALAAGVAEVATGPAPWWLLLGAGVAPDLSFLAAIGGGPVAQGQLPARAVPAYNLVHRPLLPLALLAAGATGVAPTSSWVLAAGAGWLAHIAIDRSVGYGLRNADGWQRG